MRRTTGVSRITSMPSRMASRRPPELGAGGRSGWRIAIAQTAASANAAHCTAIARLGPTASISWPPSAGPLTIPVAQTVESRPCARPNCAGPTICAIAPKAAASANVRAMPTANATASTSHSGVEPQIAQSGTARAQIVCVECADDDHAPAAAAIAGHACEEAEEDVGDEAEDGHQAGRRGVAAGVEHDPGQRHQSDACAERVEQLSGEQPAPVTALKQSLARAHAASTRRTRGWPWQKSSVAISSTAERAFSSEAGWVRNTSEARSPGCGRWIMAPSEMPRSPKRAAMRARTPGRSVTSRWT